MHKSTIEHKYSVGQIAYFLSGGKVESALIQKIIIVIDNIEATTRSYYLKRPDLEGFLVKAESEIFDTKKDLLAAL